MPASTCSAVGRQVDGHRRPGCRRRAGSSAGSARRRRRPASGCRPRTPWPATRRAPRPSSGTAAPPAFATVPGIGSLDTVTVIRGVPVITVSSSNGAEANLAVWPGSPPTKVDSAVDASPDRPGRLEIDAGDAPGGFTTNCGSPVSGMAHPVGARSGRQPRVGRDLQGAAAGRSGVADRPVDGVPERVGRHRAGAGQVVLEPAGDPVLGRGVRAAAVVAAVVPGHRRPWRRWRRSPWRWRRPGRARTGCPARPAPAGSAR